MTNSVLLWSKQWYKHKCIGDKLYIVFKQVLSFYKCELFLVMISNKNSFNTHVICNIVTCDKYKSWSKHCEIMTGKQLLRAKNSDPIQKLDSMSNNGCTIHVLVLVTYV